jgi:hypothetical protein
LVTQRFRKTKNKSMRIPTHPRIGSRIGTLLVCLSAALLLCSCKKTPQQKIVGTWNVDGSPSVVEFHKDGTFVSTDNGKGTPGKYRFTDDSHLEMEARANVRGTNTIYVSINCEIAFHGDKADLTLTIPGKPGTAPVSQTLHYTRAN